MGRMVSSPQKGLLLLARVGYYLLSQKEAMEVHHLLSRQEVVMASQPLREKQVVVVYHPLN